MNEQGQAPGSFSWRSVHALPATSSRLFGQEPILMSALDHLRAGGRLLVLTGSAGSGKTRLAIEIARRLAGQEQPAAFLQLAPLRDSAVLPGWIATVCGIDGWPDLPIARLPESLELVLVLDGFDHMQDAGTTMLALLERCPKLIAIVTSRDAPQLPGELAITVGPLAISSPGDGVADAEMLLLDRAGLFERGGLAAGALASRTGGNPLALELMAGKLRAGDAPPVFDDIGDHWPVADVVSECIAAAPVSEQRLLRRLAVMAAGFDIHAAVALERTAPSSKEETGVLLDRLVRRGLVAGPVTAGGPGRFEIPAAVREVALSQLNESGELTAMRLAYARHLLERASAQRELLFGRNRPAALLWFEMEQAGLRLALGTLVQLRRSPLARRLVAALWPFWLFRRSFRTGRRWLKLALELFDPTEPDDLEQELLVASGLLELYGGNRSAARTRSVAGSRPGLAGTQDDWRSASLATLGLLAALEGDHNRAIGLYRIFLESTEPHKRFNTWLPPLRAVIRLALSAAHFAQGALEEAEYHATVALRNALHLGDPLLAGYARLHLAAIAAEREQWLDAIERYREGISLLEDQAHAGAVATGLLGVARLALRMEAYPVAARSVEMAQQVLDAGTPPPPHLIQFDAEAMQAVLRKLSHTQFGGVEPAGPIKQMSDLEGAVERSLSELTDRLTPAAAATGRRGPMDLTSRELEVLCLMTEDMSDREIAGALFIGTRTAEHHVRNVIGKLGVKSRVGAVAHALREDWCS